jgi:hypothetical protein
VSEVVVMVCIISLGQFSKTGARASFKQGFERVIVNVQVAVLFLASFAVYVTVVVPNGKAAPELYVLVTEGVPQLSVAVGSVHETVSDTVFVVVRTIFVGQFAKTGFSASVAQGFVTMTLKEQVVVLLLASFAV